MAPEHPINNDLTLIAGFLARRDVEALDRAHLGQALDVLALIGSSLLITAEVAASAIESGAVKEILVSGGVGHSTVALRDNVLRASDLAAIPVEGRSEAEILAGVLTVRHGIDPSKILIESRSTNCGANAWETKRVLAESGRSPGSLAIVQDPTMQRRTHAAFERAWRGEPMPQLISFAPFIPVVVDGAIAPSNQWPFERFVSLVLGEIPRLRDDQDGYGPRGRDFIEHVEIPHDVEAAHVRLAAEFKSLRRVAE